ncbi:unnamed protein product [Discosporangium mesarthrocarpum]
MMFLLPVGRPRQLSNGVWFDGMIGIWPIVDVVMTQRASKSRPKGDPGLRPATVDWEKYKKVMIDEVIPAIKAKMPRPPGHTIFVQQAGAKPRVKKGVMEAIQAELGTASDRDPDCQLPRS